MNDHSFSSRLRGVCHRIGLACLIGSTLWAVRLSAEEPAAGSVPLTAGFAEADITPAWEWKRRAVMGSPITKRSTTRARSAPPCLAMARSAWPSWESTRSVCMVRWSAKRANRSTSAAGSNRSRSWSPPLTRIPPVRSAVSCPDPTTMPPSWCRSWPTSSRPAPTRSTFRTRSANWWMRSAARMRPASRHAAERARASKTRSPSTAGSACATASPLLTQDKAIPTLWNRPDRPIPKWE